MVFILSLVFNLFLGCSGGAELVIPAEFGNHDYYFLEQGVQILGHASLPASSMVSPNSGERVFFTLNERRHLCKEKALFNSHTKWLGLTMWDQQDQAEWALRLKMGAQGVWSGCLERGVVLRHFYDEQDSCGVVVWFDCLPRDF